MYTQGGIFMKEKQKILNIFSIVIIIWQIISGIIKFGICSILLLCCIITCSSTEIANTIAEKINNNILYSNQLHNAHFSNDSINAIINNYVSGTISGNDVRTIAGIVSILIFIIIIEILIIKIYFITCGFFGLRCSKNPEKGKPAFVLGCIGVVIAFLQAFLTYLGSIFIMAVIAFATSTIYGQNIIVSTKITNTIIFPIVFIAYTALIGVTRHKYKENTEAFKNIT